MNYAEVIAAAQLYADRYDAEVTDNMDQVLRLAESRINRRLKLRQMTTRATMMLVDNQEYYPLPPDFAGMRDVENSPTDGPRRTLTYFNPEQANEVQARGSTGYAAYTIIADQLQLIPPQADGNIEIVYYQRVPPLTATEPENWASKDYPDLYRDALMSEIELLVKNDERAVLWDTRLNKTVDELVNNDQEERWSGTPMQIRVM